MLHWAQTAADLNSGVDVLPQAQHQHNLQQDARGGGGGSAGIQLPPPQEPVQKQGYSGRTPLQQGFGDSRTPPPLQQGFGDGRTPSPPQQGFGGGRTPPLDHSPQHGALAGQHSYGAMPQWHPEQQQPQQQSWHGQLHMPPQSPPPLEQQQQQHGGPPRSPGGHPFQNGWQQQPPTHQVSLLHHCMAIGRVCIRIRICTKSYTVLLAIGVRLVFLCMQTPAL